MTFNNNHHLVNKFFSRAYKSKSEKYKISYGMKKGLFLWTNWFSWVTIIVFRNASISNYLYWSRLIVKKNTKKTQSDDSTCWKQFATSNVSLMLISYAMKSCFFINQFVLLMTMIVFSNARISYYLEMTCLSRLVFRKDHAILLADSNLLHPISQILW
jgi:hypothetical protein